MLTPTKSSEPRTREPSPEPAGNPAGPTQPFLSLLQTKMVNLCYYLIRSRIIRETSSGHVCGDIILVKLIRWGDSYTLGGTILGLGS